MRLSHLRINHMVSPVIDGSPEFSWRLESEKKNVTQTAYRIVVSDNEELTWDSGKVTSNRQSFISYEGAPLRSRNAYTVFVTVWNNKCESAEAVSSFETGVLQPTDWTAKWIESTIPRNEAKLFTYGIVNPAVRFLRCFTLSGAVRFARLYVSCYGCYRVSVNGVRPDDREFAPEFTPYDKILNYQTYDVTELLKSGGNELTLLVGDGWFFCPQTAVNTEEVHERPAVIYELAVTFANGDTALVCSNGSETVQTTNILFSDLFMGERQDRTLPDGAPQPVRLREDFKLSHLRAQPLPPVRPAELIPAKRIYVSPKGETIVDFGQVLAGRARIFIDAPRGTEITFEYTEVTDKDGNYFATTSLRQCDTVVSDGVPFTHEAAFTFHGFRFIRVSGLTNAKKEDFTAVLLTTQKENAGAFSCSDERFNRLYKNIRYSQKSNMLSIPTDCPTREKAGWTGDILIYAETAALNEDVTPFLTNWLRGLSADQLPSGVVPLVSPLTKLYDSVAMRQMTAFGAKEQTGIAGWGDAIVWVPWALYRVTGNRSILEGCYPAMQRWCDYIIRTAQSERGSDLPEEIDQWLWNTGFHFGEWLVPGKPSEGFEICKETAPYIAPFFGYQTMRYMAAVSEALGVDAAVYGKAAEKMKEAIIRGIFDTDRLPRDYMGAYALAFAFGLVPEQYREEYAGRLISLVEATGGCLATGFLATPFLLPALDIIGRHDLALKILQQNKAPSWLYEVKMGATSVWENWLAMSQDGTPAKTSFNHYAFGVVDSYLCKTVCGIDTDAPGFAHILIHPDKDLFSSFRRVFICEKGEIIVEKDEDRLFVTIPCNSTAVVDWNGKNHKIGSGTYHFE